ncbi:uncharacterized protein AC631_04425 [Debaryomyces fabryi]|uniref:Uncharacterized protein n=1 Tax=Debaryomyces fabryi TaxID=58627 RepID=A0A0V1PUE3_9ASCO|nr:uncharacterized protein AC631_04425 [Debaryomyces fabryi]KRZ99829.1 hypothetical protein AC631_04425 [Debaryomyces fabryi]CUM47867.1 unnamed protein product [Debaryomyces fabryi]
MDKIQLMTQPEKPSASEAPQERTLQKLKDLVSEYLPDAKDEEQEAENKEKTEEEEKGKDKEGNGNKINGLSKREDGQPVDKVTQGSADAKEGSEQTQEKEDEKEREDDAVEYDEDGFEIPQGKIPLDGHFSTSEIKELVKLSKEEGILKEDINIKVLESNEAIGDKVVISEEPDKDKKNKDKEDEDKEGKEDEDKSKVDRNEKKNEENEKSYKDKSADNSIDPKDKAKQYQNKGESE